MLKNRLKKGFLIVKLRFAFLPTAFIVYWILVHYRVGSLENLNQYCSLHHLVHYRVGSLEINQHINHHYHAVHYRVGSLENYRVYQWKLHSVHYRVGSLEK